MGILLQELPRAPCLNTKNVSPPLVISFLVFQNTNNLVFFINDFAGCRAQWSSKLLSDRGDFFIALHFSTSCAKCIAVIASGCLPQRLFTPCITMLAYCSPQNRVQFAIASIYGVREVHPGITFRSVGYQVKSNTGYSLI